MIGHIPPSAAAAVPEFCRKWNVTEFAVFGSVLRDDFNDDSDVDVLLTFQPDTFWGIDEWIVMRDELEAIFGRRVDLVNRDSLRNPFRRNAILSSRRVLHAA